jgi:hypothetical protein
LSAASLSPVCACLNVCFAINWWNHGSSSIRLCGFVPHRTQPRLQY